MFLESNKCALSCDCASHDKRINLFSALIRIDGFSIGDKSRDIVLNENTISAK